MLDLLAFFRVTGDSFYCVVKRSEAFPGYRTGEDVDIFCYCVPEFVKKLLAWGDPYVSAGYRIRVRSVVRNRHVHVDFLRGRELEFRFDLYGEIPAYAKVAIKPALFESVVENARPVPFPAATGDVLVRMPSPVDDALIRYLEFVEWYDVRPDKLKHLEHILQGVDEPSRGRFLEKMHHYTALPPAVLPEPDRPGILGRIARFFGKLRR